MPAQRDQAEEERSALRLCHLAAARIHPVPQTAEYSKASMVSTPSAVSFGKHRIFQDRLHKSAETGARKSARSTASVRMAAAASDPCKPIFGTPISSTAPPNEWASSGNGASEKSIPLKSGVCALPVRDLATRAMACPCFVISEMERAPPFLQSPCASECIHRQVGLILGRNGKGRCFIVIMICSRKKRRARVDVRQRGKVQVCESVRSTGAGSYDHFRTGSQR